MISLHCYNVKVLKKYTCTYNQQVPAYSAVKVNGKLIKPSQTKVYIMLNKPEGYVSTVSDQFGRPTVLDLIKQIKQTKMRNF